MFQFFWSISWHFLESENAGNDQVGDLENREPRLQNIVSAPQSTAASAAGIQATFICGGFSGEADAKREGAHSPCQRQGRGGYFVFVWGVLT